MKHGLDRLRLAVAWIIVVLWLVLVIIQTIDASRPVPANVHALMLIVAGFLFGPTIVGKARDRGDDVER